ncbi:MAG: BNR-4 repeat-containing protein [Bacteroidales bacterium]|nr:BNR-4 repeat-containing protein [Bacteroidales bacterium]
MEKQYFRKICMLLLAILGLGTSIFASNPVDDYLTLTQDGAWCWFADPRAVYHKGEKEQTYFTWVNSQGDIMIASYNHETGEYIEKIIHANFEIDDHDVPALLIREDGRIIVFYSMHQASGPMRRVISTNPEDITSFSSAYTWGSNVSYPNPFQVGDSICLLYRGVNWHPTIAVSTDNGQTFPDVKQLVLNGGARPYARYCQSQDGSIHIAVTTGHPRNEAQNKIFYFRLKDNKFYKADGTLIKEFTTGIDLGDNTGANSEAEIAYNGIDNGRSWIWDITIDPETQNPVMVYASFPTESDHRYNYAYWDGEKWINKEIVKSGKWFPQTPAASTEREPHYSGGLSMDHQDPWTIYLSKQVDGVFEIFKYETEDKGETWNITPVTENTSEDIVNVRPIVPRNHKEGYFDVLWMRGKYGYYYKDFKTSLVFQMSSKTDDIKSIEFNEEDLVLTVGDTETLRVSFDPIISNNELVWSSSDESIATVENGIITALSLGETEIVAKTVNNKTATCKLIVNEREYLKEAFFDFGTDKSSLAEGAIRITESTLLKGSYGWLSPVMSRDRTNISDSEKKDFNLFSQPASFVVYVENGDYNISILQGDTDYMHDNMQIKLNDEVIASGITCQKNQFKTTEHKATIENNQMNFEFSIHGTDPNWIVNSIKIVPEFTSIVETDKTEDIFNPAATVTVYNLLGHTLVKDLLGHRSYRILCMDHKLTTGIYIIKIETDNAMKIVKLTL